MPAELDDLYQQVILDHSKRPRNFGALPQADHVAEGYNPLCGDRVTVQLQIRDDAVSQVAFHGAGCAICTASASMMTESVKGKTPAQVQSLFQAFHDLVTGRSGAERAPGALGKLAAFTGVRKYPVRVKCASLPWHTLKAALERKAEAVSTE